MIGVFRGWKRAAALAGAVVCAGGLAADAGVTVSKDGPEASVWMQFRVTNGGAAAPVAADELTAGADGGVYLAGHTVEGDAAAFVADLSAVGGPATNYLAAPTGQLPVDTAFLSGSSAWAACPGEAGTLGSGGTWRGDVVGSASSVAAEGSNLYVATKDGSNVRVERHQTSGGTPVAMSFDSGGGLLLGEAVASDGRVFVTGGTTGAGFGQTAALVDAFVVGFDDAGQVIMTGQIEVDPSADVDSFDVGQAVAVDGAGNVFVAGRSKGADGQYDAFLSMLVPGDATAAEAAWTSVLAAPSADEDVRAVTVDAAGNIYVAGSTAGAVVGTNAVNGDGFLAAFDKTGAELWRLQVGSAGQEDLSALLFSDGVLYAAGATTGDLFGERSAADSIREPFVLAIPLPEPGAAVLLLIGVAFVLPRGRRGLRR